MIFWDTLYILIYTLYIDKNTMHILSYDNKNVNLILTIFILLWMALLDTNRYFLEN